MTARLLFFIFTSLVIIDSISGQYFGKNKPRYTNFEFKTVETPHYLISHYLENDTVIRDLVNFSELWYQNHNKFFGKAINFKNPVLIYNSHPEFQQTNAISGEIGVGTGGVTEAFKNRVVFPLAYSQQSTQHVFIHELVHAFQFNYIINSDSTSLRNLANVPLWMVEGMSEYLSRGKVDPFTSMWMRDAVIHNKLPDINKMDDYKYFPYRYGQALLAYLGGTYGDNYIVPLFENTALYGLEIGFATTFLKDTKTISQEWHQALKAQFSLPRQDKVSKPQGKVTMSDDKGGKMNLSPVISPNGKYVIFLSEKDIFNMDLFLADVNRGTILNKVTSFTTSGDLDYINGYESAGCWSPNGKDFAFVGTKKGRNVLVIKDADTGKEIETFDVEGLPAFVNPVYHPQGKEIIVLGLVDGMPDLYSINIKTQKAHRLTHDKYSESMPSFSSDGKMLAFSYDKKSVDANRINGVFSFDLAIMDYETKEIKILDIFHGANNLNPVFDFEDNIYFVSDRDGKRNLYKYLVPSGKVLQETDLNTGISGISDLSPMISASSKKDKMVYTYYTDGGYTLMSASAKDLLNQEVEDTKTIDFSSGTLPTYNSQKVDYVDNSFKNSSVDIQNIDIKYKSIPFKSSFKLDYVGGGGGIGLGVNSNSFRSSTGLQGGIDMLFSDLLGNHQIYSQVALNGEITDLGGIVSYINRKHPIAWGVGLSHVPLRTGYESYAYDTILYSNAPLPVLKNSTNIVRVFDQSLSLFAHLPFSTNLRLEAGIAGTRRSFRWDEYNDYYYGDNFIGYQLVASDKLRIPTDESLVLDEYYTIKKGYGSNVNIALVGDNSYFGMTSPLAGHRFRIGLEQYFGNDVYTAFLADGRKYFRFKPITFAVRGMAYLREETQTYSVYPNFIGNMGFVRGLGSYFTGYNSDLNLSSHELLGSKLLLTSAEVRLPFTGPKNLGLIASNFLLTDLNLFFDAGVVFNEFNEWSDGKLVSVIKRDEDGNPILRPDGIPEYELKSVKPTIIPTLGLSLRINLFGALILEPYYARPLLDGGKFVFGMNFIPGW
ncbi:MAG: hypothetical protein R2774_07055 [Saprospiraceae bacterium]